MCQNWSELHSLYVYRCKNEAYQKQTTTKKMLFLWNTEQAWLFPGAALPHDVLNLCKVWHFKTFKAFQREICCLVSESSCRSTVQQIANPQEWQITKHDVFWSTLNQILQNGSVSSWYMKSREGTFKSKTGRPLYSMSRPKDWQNHVPSLVTKVVWLLWFSQKVV